MLRNSSIAALVCGLLAVSCTEPPRTVLERLLESRRLSAEMLVQFEKALEAGNRAVIADTDDATTTAVQDAQRATQAIQAESGSLGGLLTKLDYTEEQAVLQEFSTQFEKLRTIDQEILSLAALNTNVQAQRLSFGTGQAAAARFAAALEPLRSGGSPAAHALASDAVAALREIQALQAPHIAEPLEAVMDRIEEQMRAQEGIARKSLSTLLTTAEGRPAAQNASREFDTFIGIHSEILRLSRRNSNVRSLALSLGTKRVLAAQCEERLRALQQALEKRDISAGTR